MVIQDGIACQAGLTVCDESQVTFSFLSDFKYFLAIDWTEKLSGSSEIILSICIQLDVSVGRDSSTKLYFSKWKDSSYFSSG